MAQRVLHGIDFRDAPLNHENIGIYEARRRANVYTGSKRCKVYNDIIIFALEHVKKRFCSVRCKGLSRIWHPPTGRQKCHTGCWISPDCVRKINLSSNYIEKSSTGSGRKVARKGTMAKVTIH